MTIITFAFSEFDLFIWAFAFFSRNFQWWFFAKVINVSVKRRNKSFVRVNEQVYKTLKLKMYQMEGFNWNNAKNNTKINSGSLTQYYPTAQIGGRVCSWNYVTVPPIGIPTVKELFALSHWRYHFMSRLNKTLDCCKWHHKFL